MTEPTAAEVIMDWFCERWPNPPYDRGPSDSGYTKDTQALAERLDAAGLLVKDGAIQVLNTGLTEGVYSVNDSIASLAMSMRSILRSGLVPVAQGSDREQEMLAAIDLAEAMDTDEETP